MRVEKKEIKSDSCGGKLEALLELMVDSQGLGGEPSPARKIREKVLARVEEIE